MQLMMYIGNDLIEAVSVDSAFISIPGYLGGFKRQLKQKHLSLIQESVIQPEFLVINMVSATSTTTVASAYTAATIS